MKNVIIACLILIGLIGSTYAGYSKVNCADIYLADNASATTVSVAGTWYTMTGTWAENSLNEWTRSGGVLTSPAVGGGAEYFIVWSASLASVAEDDLRMTLRWQYSAMGPELNHRARPRYQKMGSRMCQALIASPYSVRLTSS